MVAVGKIKQLTARLDELKPVVLGWVKPVKELTFGERKFIVGFKPTYKYTAEIEALEVKLAGQKGLIDARKKKEIESGAAVKVDDGEYVKVVKIKTE